VQVKYCVAKAGVIAVRCTSHSLTNGKVRSTKYYTARTIDWLAAYDPSSARCYTAALNNQQLGIRMAADYTEI
jgi:hypothetical protein